MEIRIEFGHHPRNLTFQVPAARKTRAHHHVGQKKAVPDHCRFILGLKN